MEKVFIIYIGMAIVISVIALKADKVDKGFKSNAKDGDGDGLVQDGTRWQRRIKR